MLQMTVVPAAVVYRNQSVQGTLVSNMADVGETLHFAKRGRAMPPTRCLLSSTDTGQANCACNPQLWGSPNSTKHVRH